MIFKNYAPKDFLCSLQQKSKNFFAFAVKWVYICFIMIYRRILLLFLTCSFVFGGFATAPAAKAADPVSWAVLAPFAIRMADRMAPYAEKGFVTGLQAMVRIVYDIVEILKLPLGLLACTVGAPWFFRSGCYLVGEGIVAPFKLGFHVLLLPLAMLGANVM